MKYLWLLVIGGVGYFGINLLIALGYVIISLKEIREKEDSWPHWLWCLIRDTGQLVLMGLPIVTRVISQFRCYCNLRRTLGKGKSSCLIIKLMRFSEDTLNESGEPEIENPWLKNRHHLTVP